MGAPHHGSSARGLASKRFYPSVIVSVSPHISITRPLHCRIPRSLTKRRLNVRLTEEL